MADTITDRLRGTDLPPHHFNLACEVCHERTRHALAADAADTIDELQAALDAERALADRLARALLDRPFRGDRRERMYGSDWSDVHDALDTWEAARRG